MEPNNKSNGALVGSVIIILILIIGGIYFYNTKISKETETPEVNTSEVDTEASAINAELNAFDTANTNSSEEFNIDSSVEGL